ncbi:MAG: hypothetical protein ABIO70_35230 [Pseudomonadota bacterium]
MRRLVALALGLLSCGTTPGTEVSTEPLLVEARDLAVPLENLLAPTDVAIAADGAVFVLDSGAGLLYEIAADGSRPMPRKVTGEPVGLGWAGGRLWWPHTDAPTLTALDPASGELVDEAVPVGDLEEVRLTDIAQVGERLVVCDVRGHAWMRPLEGGDWAAVPQELHGSAPFLAAPAGGAWVALADVRSYAVALLDLDSGEYARIGQWGPWEGTFLHPAGLAVDSAGRLFVADGLQGVVQVFDPEGRFLGAVGLDGGLLRMDHPPGAGRLRRHPLRGGRAPRRVAGHDRGGGRGPRRALAVRASGPALLLPPGEARPREPQGGRLPILSRRLAAARRQRLGHGSLRPPRG